RFRTAARTRDRPTGPHPAPTALNRPERLMPSPPERPVPGERSEPAPAAGPPASAVGSKVASKSGSVTKDLRGLSNLDESALEKSIIRRGLATPQEVEYCKQQRVRLQKEKGESPGLIPIMIAAKALTESQAKRLCQEIAATETQKKLQIPGYQMI